VEATVGDEGMLGTEAFLVADAVASGDTLIPDTDAVKMSVDDFGREIEERGAFRDLIGRYTQNPLRADDAVHRVQRASSSAATMRSLVADGPRPNALTRFPVEP